jgi:chemotaxis protein MotB
MADSHDKHAEGESGHKSGGGGGHRHGGGGHGGGGHEEAHEGAPEWLISFADNVALMMGFFVVLLCMNMAKDSVGGGGSKGDTGISQEKEETMLDFALAVREAFNNPVDMDSSNSADQALIERLKKRAGKSDTRVPGVAGHEQDVQSIRPSEYYAVSGSVPFGEDSSDLTPAGRNTIREIAGKVRGMNLVVEVRGHVSSVEAGRGPEHSMKLSSDRSVAVAHALADEGVDWWQMRLVLCADHDRVQSYPSSTEADRANARVEIILTDKVVPDKIPTRNGDRAASAAGSSAGH